MLKEKIERKWISSFPGVLIFLCIFALGCEQRSTLESDEPTARVENVVTETNRDPVTIRFVIARESQLDDFRRFAIQYTEENPTVTIEIDHQDIEKSRLTAESLVGDADCFEWLGPIRYERDLEATIAVESFLDADQELSEESFFPAALESFRHQDDLIGLPSAVHMKLLAYDKQLFDQAGIDYPQQGWTLDDFLDAAIAISAQTADGQKVYGYVPDHIETGGLIDFIHLQGVELFDRSQTPLAANFDDPNLAEALSWYANLTLEHESKPDFVNSQSFEDAFELREELVTTGRAGMWPMGRDSFFVFGSPQMAHIGAVPFPKGSNGAEIIEATKGYYISSDTQVAQPCWEWMKFLTTQVSIGTGPTPARIDTAESEAYASSVGAELAKVQVEALKNSEKGVTRPHDFFGDWTTLAIGFLGSALNEVMIEGTTAEEALQTAQSEFLAYRECIIENDLLETADIFPTIDTCITDPDHPFIYWTPSVLRAPKE